MKFGQAFYTWRGNEQSRYDSGLGVSVSSTQDRTFLDNCRILGSDFQPERTTKTVVFNVYSERFDAHIGVGISPAEQKGDGRANMLCHFFFPMEKGNSLPETYLLDFPFVREEDATDVLEEIELQAESYSYEQILEKYQLDQRKLAELLYKSYQCLFLEKEQLTILIDKSAWVEEQYQTVAREIIWLLHQLIPYAGKESCVHHKYLSFGVCSTTNTSVVKFHFTDEVQGAEFVFNLGQAEKKPIPEIFSKLAVLAIESKEKAQEFLDVLMEQQLSGKLNMLKLELLYLNYKLEQGIYVSTQDIGSRMQNIMRQADRSDWHFQCMKRFLLQIHKEELDNQQLVVLWKRVIAAWMDHYTQLCEEDKQDILQIIEKMVLRMYELNKSHFTHFLMQIPSEIKKELLKKEAFQGDILPSMRRIYEKSTRTARQLITNMLSDGMDWKTYVLEKGMQIEDCEEYLSYLTEELKEIEPEFVQECYDRLFYFAEKQPEPEVQKKIQKMEETLRTMEKAQISRVKKQAFAELFQKWKREDSKSHIEQSDILELLEIESSLLSQEENKEIWFRELREKLDHLLVIEEPIYANLCNKYAQIYRLFYRKDPDAVKDYEQMVWNCVSKDDDVLEKRMLFQKTLMSMQRYSPDFDIWEEIDAADEVFEELDRIFRKYPGMSIIKKEFMDSKEKSKLNRKSYLAWKNKKIDQYIHAQKIQKDIQTECRSESNLSMQSEPQIESERKEQPEQEHGPGMRARSKQKYESYSEPLLKQETEQSTDQQDEPQTEEKKKPQKKGLWKLFEKKQK